MATKLRCNASSVKPAARRTVRVNAAQQVATRRCISSLLFMTLPVMAAQAAEPAGVAVSGEELPAWAKQALERSIANKEAYQKERLNDYYRRNYKDYFDFDAGDARAAKARGITEGTRAQIMEWMEKNK